MAANIPDSPYPRVVIVGGGFGGINVANKLRKAKVQLVMLDRNNHHTFQPLLYQVATSGLEAGSIAYPLRKVIRSKNYHFRMAEVEQVLPAENKIKTSLGDISYDYLVLSTGSKTNYFGMKDLEENALPLKTVSQAIDMRHIILMNFENMLSAEDAGERQRLMNFAIAGGGPTGVELAGALSELRKKVLPKDYPELDFSQMRIMILDPGTKVLASMSEDASRNAQKYLEGFGVELKFGAGVKSYDGKNAVLSTGEILPTETLIWAAGVTSDIPEGFDKMIMAKGNRILVDEFNHVKGMENIFAIGDIAQHETPEDPRGLPMLAPVAIQQGQHLAKNIKRLIAKEKIEPFKYFDKGSLATIGRQKAVADLTKKIHFGGFIAWVAWLFVHLFYLIGFRNKLMVFTDWVWNYFTFDRRVRLIIRPVVKKQRTTTPG
ncbi:MAG: NAD(P)/FAD-dependent oxidoreductase [Bacteroidia bacterium]